MLYGSFIRSWRNLSLRRVVFVLPLLMVAEDLLRNIDCILDPVMFSGFDNIKAHICVQTIFWNRGRTAHFLLELAYFGFICLNECLPLLVLHLHKLLELSKQFHKLLLNLLVVELNITKFRLHLNKLYLERVKVGIELVPLAQYFVGLAGTILLACPLVKDALIDRSQRQLGSEDIVVELSSIRSIEAPFQLFSILFISFKMDFEPWQRFCCLDTSPVCQ